MLAGQIISLGDSVIISLTGILIVMLELAFLAVFIQIMSKVLASIAERKSQSDDDLAIIMTAVLEETEWPMEEVIFRSIVRLDKNK